MNRAQACKSGSLGRCFKPGMFFGLVAIITATLSSWLDVQAQTFSDVTVSAGITHVHQAAFAMSAGAAAGDVDGDGWVDLFVSLSGVDILYRNLGNGTFENASATSGFTQSRNTNGAAFGDIDNDGDLDLYLTSVGESQYFLYINNGSGVFTEDAVNRNAHVAIDGSPVRQGMGICLGDCDNNGFLDIFTAEWRYDNSMNGGNDAGARLLMNQGATNPGHFTDTTDSSGVWMGATGSGGEEGIFVFAPRFADVNNDGLQDLAVVADYRTSRLFLNNGDGTFCDVATAVHVGTDRNGMGTDMGDIDNDGDLDWFVTSKEDNDGNRLYENQLANGGGFDFVDRTDVAGVRNGGWGWGASMFDFDNDGHLDIVMTNGFGYDEQMRLWHNNGDATFTEVSDAEGIIDTGQGRGLLTFDYDNDGDLDIYVANNNGPAVLYRNNTNTPGGGSVNNWLKINTIGRSSNRDGIGAKIMVDPDLAASDDQRYRFVDAGSNFVAQSELGVHFGLGNLNGSSIDLIEIKWPSGIVQTLYDAAPDQSLTVIETLLGDVNLDGVVNLLDVNPFVDRLSTGTFQTEADFNQDGVVNLLDVQPFIALLSGG